MYIFHLCYQGEKLRDNRRDGDGGSVEISPLPTEGEGVYYKLGKNASRDK